MKVELKMGLDKILAGFMVGMDFDSKHGSLAVSWQLCMSLFTNSINVDGDVSAYLSVKVDISF